jgi:Spy/CpxP family protein refolding chaperone
MAPGDTPADTRSMLGWLRSVHRRTGFRLGVGAAVLAWVSLAGLGAQHASPPKLWWRDPSIQRELGLTSAQAAKIDAIFQRDLPARIALHDTIDRLDAELRGLISEERDQSARQIVDQLEALRRKQAIRRTLMLLDMYRVLTPTQRGRVQTQGQKAKEAKRPGPARPRP